MINKTSIRVLVTALALFAVSFSLSAQEWGIKGGVNLGKPVGYNIGVAMKYNLPIRGTSIQPELSYVSRPISVSGSVQKGNYLELPLNLQAGFDLILFRPFIEVSPFVGYLLSKNSGVPSFEYGVGVGGGIDIRSFQLKAKYSWGHYFRGTEIAVIYFF